MDKDTRIQISRRLYKTNDFQKDNRKQSDFSLLEQLKNSFRCSPSRLKKFLSNLFPFIRIYRKYSLKSDLFLDVISGLTVGVMHLPQGMAYAILAHLPTYSGLYTSLFPAITYFFFGTSKHVSIGTGALVALLLGSAIADYGTSLGEPIDRSLNTSQSITNLNNTVETLNNLSTTTKSNVPSSSGFTSQEIELKKLYFATTLCLMVGLVQIIFAILHLGFIATYISAPIIGGFISAGTIELIISQIKDLLGIEIPEVSGYFQFIKTAEGIILNITDTNIPTLITSLICLVVLFLVTTQVNERFKQKMKIPIPIDFVVLVLGTIVSYFAKLNKTYDIRVIGNIPLGFPTPTVPPIDNVTSYLSTIIIVAVISFAQAVSVAKLMAKKYNYSVDANQEMLAYGISNTFASFFLCMPLGGSLARTSVQQTLGRTQIASAISIALLLIIILVIGPWFESLPSCVLSAIIVVTLKDMLLKIKDSKIYWKTCKWDFLIWLCTFLGVLFLAFDTGMIIGIVVGIWSVLFRTQRTRAKSLENIRETELYREENKYNNTCGIPGVKVVGYRSPIYFANAELYMRFVQKATGVFPDKITKRMKRHEKKLKKQRKEQTKGKGKNGHVNVGMEPVTDNGVLSTIDDDKTTMTSFCSVRYIILDLSSVLFIDTVGCKILKQIMSDYNYIKVKVILVGLNDYVWTNLTDMDFVEKYEDNIYLTVQDAVVAIGDSNISEFENQTNNIIDDDDDADDDDYDLDDDINAERELEIENHFQTYL